MIRQSFLLASVGFLLVLFFACKPKNSSSPPPGSDVGKTGSLARFAIVGDHLYAVNDRELKTFDISNPSQTREVSKQTIDFRIETIFGSYPHIFIVGQQGLYIYDAGSAPTFISQFGHARACDPVVVENDYAFITLKSSGMCPGSANELKVVDVSNIRQPNLVKNYPLTSPIDLASNKGRLYICDGDNLKLFDSTDVQKIQLKKTTTRNGCMDIIYDRSAVIVTSGQGITQYDVSNDEFELLSHLGF